MGDDTQRNGSRYPKPDNLSSLRSLAPTKVQVMLFEAMEPFARRELQPKYEAPAFRPLDMT
jgi:hypothetical protein